MTGAELQGLVAALIATSTPLVVVAVVYRLAQAQVRTVSAAMVWPAPARRLVWATAVAAVVAVVVSARQPAPSLVAAVTNLLLFGLLSLPAIQALDAIDRDSRPAREVRESTRVASVTRRRTGDFLDWRWRALAYVVAIAGLSVFVARLVAFNPARQVVVPCGFALAAAAFLFLYEVWLHQIVTGPMVGADAARRGRIVRRIFAAEMTLLIVTLGVAHALLDLDWNTHGEWGAALSLAAAPVAIVGCALALGSGLQQRQYGPPEAS